MEDNTVKTQTFEFKAEMQQLLNLIVHSLYTHPEVFLRELVSNASDALNKVRFRRLTEQEMLSPENELKISISLDKENNIFTIEDTGIGMTQEDLVNQIGTVAKSGTLEFLQKLKESRQSMDGQLIGQFGVGFYSVYMVTDEITVETRHADKDSKAYRWKSAGKDTYTIEEIEREERGTKITFKLRDDSKEFSEEYRIKNILQKYSNFVDFPIYVNNEEVNKVTALWHRKKDDIKVEEYEEFYKFISNDYEKPLGHLHLSIEGNVNFKALIFIPEHAPHAMFQTMNEKNLQLYSRKVFIQDDAKELLPDYLKFVRGVVDTEDLPLNVSREVTQSSPVMTKIKNVITGKILTLLEEWSDKEPEKYEKFITNFGPLFKTGVNSDYTNKERIIELLRFESSALESGKLTSFNDYVSRMKEENSEIYYLAGDSRQQIERNPNLEYFRKNEIEVLFLIDPVDVFTVPYIQKYREKNLISADKADIKISDTPKSEESLSTELSNSLIKIFKDTLGDKVEDVIESKRLVDSPVTLVVGSQGMDSQMEKMMQMLDKEFTSSKRILEINTAHPLIKNLSRIYLANADDTRIKNAVVQLFEGALLMEGYLKAPQEFIKRMNDFMEEATKN